VRVRESLVNRHALTLAVLQISGLAILALVYLLAKPLALLILALTVANALSPFADWLQKYMRRGLAVTLIYVTLFASVAVLGWLIVPVVTAEGARLLQTLPDLVDSARSWLHGAGPTGGGQLGRSVSSVIADGGAALLAVPLRGASFVFDLLVVVFLSLYLLVAGPALDRFVVSLFPTRHRRRATRLLHRMGSSMGGYVRGTVLDSMIVAFLTWLALAVVNLEYALVLAVVMFVGELIPYLGPVLAAVPAILVALVESPGKALTVALIYLAIEQLEGHIIAPNIMHSQTDISPALVIFALACGFAVGGIIGGLVAIPIFAAVRVLVRSLVVPLVRARSSS
jgi:predicted PurR-regulated permease PerM